MYSGRRPLHVGTDLDMTVQIRMDTTMAVASLATDLLDLLVAS